MLLVSRPSLGEEELRRIEEVFRSGWLGHGSFVLDFENRLKAYLGAQHVVAVNTGTSALHLALDAIGVGPGDEVIIPSLTFCAGPQAITALGARPVFCEVLPETLNIDLDDAEARVSPRTRAIMPLHYSGNVCDMDRLMKLGRERGLRIVEDAAHAFGSSYKGRKLGSFGDLTCFSFDPIKNITCGEGGAVALADERLAEILRRKRMLGIDRDGWQCRQDSGIPSYEVSTQGYRYHMSNINAAIGLAQLEKIDTFLMCKRTIVRRYNEAFAGIGAIRTIDWDLTAAFPFAYTFRVINGTRDELSNHLRNKGVGSGVNYIPNHLHPHFAAYSQPLPRTERLAREIITLPLHCDMEEHAVSQVIESVLSFFLD